MAVFPNSAPAPKFPPFFIKGKAGDFPASRADRLAMLAAILAQVEMRANG